MPSALFQTTHALADSAPQALGEALFAKGAVVRWRRERRGHTWNGVEAEGSFIAFCALSDTTALAMARGLRVFIASAVTERSGFGNWYYGLCCCRAVYIRKKRFIFSGV